MSRVLGTQGDPSRSVLGAEEVWPQLLRDALVTTCCKLRAPKLVPSKAGEEPHLPLGPHSRSEA